MSQVLEKAIDKASKTNKKVEKFSDLLDAIESLEDKKKHLWKEIYENAITDRENANMLFTDLYTEIQGSAAQHSLLGTAAAKYLERMCKSNDQILRLAELIAKAEEANTTINPDEIFSKITMRD